MDRAKQETSAESALLLAGIRPERVLEALEMAVGQREPDDVIHHSDQSLPRTRSGGLAAHVPGVRGARCGKAGVRPSMGAVGDGCDNAQIGAMCEGFSSPEAALPQRRFRSQAEARMAAFGRIEAFHDPVRRPHRARMPIPHPVREGPRQNRPQRQQPTTTPNRPHDRGNPSR